MPNGLKNVAVTNGNNMITLQVMRLAAADALGTMSHAVIDNGNEFLIVTLDNCSMGECGTFFADDVRKISIRKDSGRGAAGNRIEDWAADILNPYA